MMHEKNSDLLTAMMDLVGFLNSPRQDDVLLKAAGVRLDRALFPLLVRIGRAGRVNVGELADQVGRDPSTISRQIAKLEHLGLVERLEGSDRRTRAAQITARGEQVMASLATAREAALEKVVGGWTPDERETLARLTRRFVDGLRDGGNESRS